MAGINCLRPRDAYMSHQNWPSLVVSDNGLSSVRHQAIIWTNTGLLSIGSTQTYFSDILIKIQQFWLKKIHVKMSSTRWRSSCLDLNVLNPTLQGLLNTDEFVLYA